MDFDAFIAPSFPFFVNDLLVLVSSNEWLFANDAILYRAFGSENDSRSLKLVVGKLSMAQKLADVIFIFFLLANRSMAVTRKRHSNYCAWILHGEDLNSSRN